MPSIMPDAPDKPDRHYSTQSADELAASLELASKRLYAPADNSLLGFAAAKLRDQDKELVAHRTWKGEVARVADENRRLTSALSEAKSFLHHLEPYMQDPNCEVCMNIRALLAETPK